MISIIHPSRSRPDKSYQTIKKWFDKAKDSDIELILSIDTDDPLRDKYIKRYLSGPLPIMKITRPNKNAVEAINVGAQFSTGDILIIVSDDTDCFEGWDAAIKKAVEGKKDWILKVQDGIQPWVITMPIMDRTYYERFGYIYHPSYQHAFCDTEMTCVSELTGRKIEAPLIFRHLHYSEGFCGKDHINEKCDSFFEEGRKVFKERLKNNFGLKDMPGELSDNVYTRMI